MVYFSLKDFCLFPCGNGILNQLLLLSLLLVYLLEEVCLVRKKQSILECLSDLLNPIGLFQYLNVDLLLKLRCLELREVVKLNKPRVKIFQSCNCSGQVCFKLLYAGGLLLIHLLFNCQFGFHNVKLRLAKGSTFLLEFFSLILQIDNSSSLLLYLAFKFENLLIEDLFLIILLLNLLIEASDILFKVPDFGHQITDFVFQKLCHFFVQFLLVVNLPL